MISKAFTDFFKELAKNNHKEWFHANKKRYENDVKAPFLSLLNEILLKLTAWDDRILPDPKKALFRINRDIRFSKDKSPYNTIMKAGFSPGGKKSELPGYYLGIDAEHVHVGGGLFMVRPPELKKVRQHIAKNPDALTKLVHNNAFKNAFGQLKGERSKRLDKEFLEAAEQTDLIYHKQFYGFAEFPLSNFYESDRLVDEIMAHFETIKPLNAYLGKALE
ncbi:DUF2461 domain-containing protein [Allomuricauda sp. d1]|uniref:DUF2461 domain-containing protein n=1 Tax=Allomuricauda sp. d1 TaxID=3136725 RepID=UPI0031D07ADE